MFSLSGQRSVINKRLPQTTPCECFYLVFCCKLDFIRFVTPVVGVRYYLRPREVTVKRIRRRPIRDVHQPFPSNELHAR
jgi:hypothetical protein